MWRYRPDPNDEYVGNIWGWRFSLFGAGLIVVMVLLAWGVAHSRGRSLFDQPAATQPAAE